MDTEIVYVLTNEAMPGLIKIGVTSQSDLDIRIKQLYTTGVPLPFSCYYACRVPCEKKVEQKLHYAFSSMRINENREFFKLEPEKVKALLELVKVDDLTTEIEKEIEENITDEDRRASEKMKKRRPVMNFIEMGLNPGCEIIYKDGVTKAKIVDERRIEFNGENTSLTAATQNILKSDRPIQPSPHWLFNGKTLHEIYNDTYPTE